MALQPSVCHQAASLQSWFVARQACHTQIHDRKALTTRALSGPRLRACATITQSMAKSAESNLQPSQQVLTLWRTAQAVCFDVDSTLCEDESIDELAAFLGVGEEVAAMTANAMGGSVKFEDALKMRLAVMNTSSRDIQTFLAAHPPRISQGIAELVQMLHSRKTAVYLVSGGFRPIINPIAKILNIPQENVYANTILHTENGDYMGFDTNEYTSRSGGKPAAIKAIKAQHHYSPLVMVGDGATDLEARQEGGADLFIGYGGVVERPNVAAAADWYIYKIQQLIEALE